MKNWMRMMAAGVLTAAMVMGLTACGGGSKSGVDAIKDRGVVKVGVKADVLSGVPICPERLF